jgi:hypothetical protein
MEEDDPNPIDPLTPAEEAEMQKEIELAMAPYKGIAPPALLKQMREKLEEGLREHPVTRGLLRRMAPRPVVDSTTTVARDGAEQDGEAGDGKADA